MPLVSPYGDLAQRKVDYWRNSEVINLKKTATSIYWRIICLFMLFIEIQPLNCLEAKYVRNWKSETLWWALHPVRETKLCIYRPCLLDREPLRTCGDPIGACRIFSHNFPQKQWVGGGGVNVTRPSWPILIRYKRKGVEIWVNSLPALQYYLYSDEKLKPQMRIFNFFSFDARIINVIDQEPAVAFLHVLITHFSNWILFLDF